MAIVIRLLGRPSIEVDGGPGRAVRGRKTWAVLALVALSELPPTRARVVDLLFADAADPLAALRWALAELRRALGDPSIIGGDPITMDLADRSVEMDLLEWTTGRSAERDYPSAGELLAGLRFPGCEAFETWLLIERRRLSALVESRLREDGLAALGAGRPEQATRIATRLVELNPLEDAHQALFVRALTVAGHRRQAERAVDDCAQLFRRELGIEPSPQVRAALRASPSSGSAAALTGAPAAVAQLTAGTAAISAGAVDAGVDCLRRAVDEARYAGDDSLLIDALTELGGALVHTVRGSDEEGATTLHEALNRAQQARSPLVATICRELAFVDVQAGHGSRADVWLTSARAEASRRGDDRQLAAIDGVAGMSRSDQADYPAALELLTESVDRASHCDSVRQAAWSGALVGRIHLLRGDYPQARAALRRSLELIEAERWVAFLPLPQALSAEIRRLEGDTAGAQRDLRETFVLSCQLGDPCWEGVAARSLALCESDRDPVHAFDQLLDARARCTRWPDTYQWIHAFVLDAICTVAADVDPRRAAEYVNSLLILSARSGLREFIARAHLHLARLGRPGAADAAMTAAAGIVNPALTGRIAELSPA
jgi:DNA-binding SARP family transcriptional activator